LEYAPLGSTGIQVSRVAFGCEPLGGTDWGRVSIPDVTRAVEQALDLGINFFDTADVYGLGVAEEQLGQALGRRRHDVVIASKCGVAWRSTAAGRARTWRDISPGYIRRAVDASLRRLRVECVPLYYLHAPDDVTAVETAIAALDECRSAGKIRWIGLSRFASGDILKAHGTTRVQAAQFELSLMNQGSGREQAGLCKDLGLAGVAYGVLGQGLLTDTDRGGQVFGLDDRRHRLTHFTPSGLAKLAPLLSRLRSLARESGRPLAQVAIRWALETPGVTSVAVGAKTPAQVIENATACNWRMTAEIARGLETWSSEA
jgi:aryl-alcohol dehydrogenase-like predicted oxidoreductase